MMFAKINLMNASNFICVGGFWDANLFQNKNYPIFTNCFQFSLILIASLSFLTMVILYLTRYIYKSERKTKRKHFLKCHGIVEFIVPIFCAIFSIIDMMNEFYYSEKKDPLLFLSFIHFAISLIIVAVFIKTKDEEKSSIDYIIFGFWLLAIIAYTIRFYGNLIKIFKKQETFEIFILINSAFLMGTLLISLIVNSFHGFSINTEKYKNPESKISILSKITFLWMDRYIFQWFKEEMTSETVFDLDSEYKSELNTDNLEETMAKMTPPNVKKIVKKELSERSSKVNLSTNSGFILFKSLFKNYYNLYIILNVLKLFRDILYLTFPLLLEVLLKYIHDKEKQYLWKGIMLAFLFLLLGLIAAVSENYSHATSSRLLIKVRASLIGMMYKKIFKLSNISRKENDGGDIVNMCSVDIEQIIQCIALIWNLLSSPFQVIVSLLLMYLQIGPAIFSCVILLILFIPIYVIFAKIVNIFSKKEFQWKDKRMNVITEVLKGIKIIKIYTWEEAFYSKCSYNRRKEMKNMRNVTIVTYVNHTFSYLLSNALPYVMLMAYIYFVPMSNLTTVTVFITWNYITVIRYSALNILFLSSEIIKTIESLRRIENFLLSSEMDLSAIWSGNNKNDPEIAIDIRDGFFGWNGIENCILKNINLTIQKGRLVAVVGKVGVGKSTLLSAILRETPSLCGTIKIQGNFGLVSQEAWIQNMSLRNNVIFTKEYNESFYNTVTNACCLDYDISLLPMKDESEIGEGGFNLSGGQKQRISLARAIYQDSDIYLLDDPLSAMDVKVGEKIFNNIIGNDGLLKHKTRILVTHGIKWLPFMDEIIFINSEGEISEKGTFDHLMNLGKEFQIFMNECLMTSKSDFKKMEEDKAFEYVSKEKDTNSKLYEIEYNTEANEEKLMAGKVKWENIWWYVKANGVGLCILSVLICLIAFCFEGYGIFWLSKISKIKKEKNMTYYKNKKDFYKYYVDIFGLIIAGQLLFVIIYMAGFAYGSLKGSKKIYEDLIQKLLSATLSFFDFTPSGRILNRLGKDLFIIDHVLILNIIYSLRLFCISILCITMIIFVTPWSGLIIIPIIIILFLLQNLYISSFRQSARLDSKASSFILTNIIETYKGSSIIRSFQSEEDFENRHYSYIDNSNKFLFINCFSNLWFSLRLDILCNFIVFSAILFAVINRQNLDAGLVGLSVSLALQISINVNFFIKRLSELQINSVAIERIKQYTEIPTECGRDNKKKFPPNWTAKGNVSFDHFSLRYYPENPLVLNNFTLNVSAGEKIGIAGRTGAGKSSISLALFRLIEGCEGDIVIDGINIKSVGLKELRKQITILPQDPVIFNGSLRYNLDPFGEYSTDQIVESLELSGLMEWVNSLKENIDYMCDNFGNNLSVGQKQLLCLARTILKKTKIIILDEATASVDEDTGQKVMSAVKSQFIESTVFIIAHRINTIMNCDKILLLDNGSILEYGSPEELLSKVDGVFRSMVNNY